MRPSVTDKGKALLLVLLVFGAMLMAIAASDPGQAPFRKAQQTWVQPAGLASQYPEPISPYEWRFDFHRVEQHLRALPHPPGEELEFNRHTGEVLQRAAGALPDRLSDTAIERVGFLSRQGHPPPRMAEAFTGIIRYRQARRSIETEPASGNDGPRSARERFNRIVELQNRHLGETLAKRLFGHQRRLREHLIQRREIQSNPELSDRFESPEEQL